MRDASANRSAVANDPVGDQPHSVAEQRADLGHELGVFDGGLARQRLNPDPAVALVDAVHSCDAVDVDQVLRPGQAKVQERDQRLPARQHLRIFQCSEQGTRLFYRRGRVVLKRRWLQSTNATARHNAASPPWDRQGKQPHVTFVSSTSSICPPTFSIWITSCGNSKVCMIW